MDLIKLTSSTAYATELSAGEPINGWTKCTWVEKYQDPGTFKIEAPLSSGLYDFLPPGTFVTHTKTRELMRVEHIEIDQAKDKDSTIVISGRSFVAYLEERVVGQDHAAGSYEVQPYELASIATYFQIENLLNDHLVSTAAENQLPGIEVNNSAFGLATSELRTVKYNDLLTETQTLLKVDDLGIRMVRPTSTDPLSYFDIYRGENRAAKAKFSWMRGDIEDLKTFISFKPEKNCARAIGRWVQWNEVPGGITNVNRRYMIVDTSDIDQQADVLPTGTALTLFLAAMQIRAREALKKQVPIYITSANVSPNASLEYRLDYFLGDLVTVDGEFANQIMRVTEFAEIQDENGYSSVPTLSIPGE